MPPFLCQIGIPSSENELCHSGEICALFSKHRDLRDPETEWLGNLRCRNDKEVKVVRSGI